MKSSRTLQTQVALITSSLFAMTVCANAQLLHRYDFDSANDMVGTAHGALVGTASLNGGALVTDGGNGTVSGIWSGTGPRMTLDPSAVAGLTNAFTIETWFTCTTGWPKYDSLYAFSDTTQVNFLLGVPVRGYSPWPSGAGINGAGGSNNGAVEGIYLDTAGIHQAVLTYDGSNFTWYADGALGNLGASPTLFNPGFNLSTLTAVGVNGGSPWNDPSLTGSTYDFRIYGQAISPAQVAALFALGSDASYSSISNALVPPTAFTWDGGGSDNNWSTGGNWVGDAAPPLSGSSLTFAGSARTTPNLEASYSITGLTFSNNASSFTLGTGNGSTLALAGNLLNNSTNAQLLNVSVTLDVAATFSASTGNLELGGVLSGSGSISKIGSGTLKLAAANTLSGGTTISEGAVELGNANALQNSAVTLNAANGLTFKSGIGTFNLGGLSGTNGTALADAGASAVTLSIGANNAFSAYTGVLSGPGAVVKVGTGTTTLNGASTYAGGTTVSGGILAAVNGGAPGLVTPFGTGPINVNTGGLLQFGYGPTNAFTSFIAANHVTLDNGGLFVGDASQRIAGSLTIGAGGGRIGSTYNAPWEVFTEPNFPKGLFFDGLLLGTGDLTVQHSGWALGNVWNTSCAVFTSQGTAAENTYSGNVTVSPTPSGSGGSYLYLVGSNVFANATITLNGDNDPATSRMGVSTLLFGNGSLPGAGHVTIGGLAGSGSLVLADTVLFQGGAGYSNGAPVALTVGYNNSTTTYAGVMSGPGSLIKAGSGTLTLFGANTYTGNTTVSAGALVLSGGWMHSSNILVAAGAALDASALGFVNLAGNQSLLSGGTITAIVNTSTGSKIYGGFDGSYGTNAIVGDLTLASGTVAYLDLGASVTGANDRITVSGTLTANGNIIHLRAPSTAANLDATADYVLFSSANPIVGSFAPAPVWDVAPANAGHYAIVTTGSAVVLRYFADYNGPTASVSVAPSPAVRNQTVLITVTATNGNPGVVAGVTVDASQIGVSTPVALVSAGGNVWTNSAAVAPGTLVGSKTLTATVTDSAAFSAIVNIPLTVIAGNNVWNGAGGDNNFSSNLNWTNKTAPGFIGDSLEFDGVTQLAPNLDNGYTVTGVLFDSGAGAFNISSANGSTLTLAGTGIQNNSANLQTFNVPIVQSGPQTFNAAAGNLVLGQGLAKGGSLVTATGAANTVISGFIQDAGSLFKQGSGSLTISGSSAWDLAQASAGGFSGPLIAQAGTLTFNNASAHTVTGELVIGGVLTNGAAGNDAKIVVDNASLSISSWLSIGRGNGLGGVSSDLVLTNGGAVTAQNLSAGYNANNSANRPKGSIRLSDTSALTITGGSLFLGESDGSDVVMDVGGTASVTASTATMDIGAASGKGALNVNGGSVTVNVLRVGRGANNNSTAQGTVTLNSGSFRTEGDVVLGFAGRGTSGNYGRLIINNGTFNFATTTTRWMILNQWDTSPGLLEVNGGNLNINGNSSIRSSTGNSGSQAANVITLNGGAITFYSDNATTVGGTGQLDLQRSGGAGSSATVNLNGGTLTVPQVMATASSGSRVFNFNGGILRPTASRTNFLQGLSAANVMAGGAIIDTAGFDVTIAQALLNAGGGLTKNGLGILVLSGANTYAGNTTVNAGTLALVQPTLSANSTISVTNGAMLQLDFATTNRVSALVLNGEMQPAGVYNNITAAPYIVGAGSLLVQPIADTPTEISYAISGNSMAISWPEDHLGWILQQQTNTLSIGLSTNWVDLPGTASLTSVNITIDPASPTVFYRLRKP